jgi:hypothetical protein
MLISIQNFTPKKISGKTISIVFDGLMSVTPTYTSVVTRRPTEDNETITDAIHNRPIQLAVEIIITENAQSILDSRAIYNLPNLTGIKLGISNIEKQVSKLKQIRDNKEAISLETKFDTYSNYFIETFNIKESEDEAIIISFSLIQGKSEEMKSQSLGAKIGAKINSAIIGVFS